MNKTTVVSLHFEVYGFTGIASHVGLEGSESAHVFLMEQHLVRLVHSIGWVRELQDGFPDRKGLSAKLAIEASDSSLVSLKG